MADPLASLPWVFVPAVPGEGEECMLDADEARHAVGARRLRIGDEMALFDGTGAVARARLMTERARDRSVRINVLEQRFVEPSTSQVTLASALPKPDRLAVLVGMATQLGISSFVPLACGHSVREPQRNFAERIQRLFIEACKQCRRAHLPVLKQEQTPAQMASSAAAGGAALLMAHPAGRPLAECWPIDRKQAQRVVVMIGPEGGFTDDEVATAAGAGARIVGLGESVLRIETAAAAVLAWIMLASPAGRMDGP